MSLSQDAFGIFLMATRGLPQLQLSCLHATSHKSKTKGRDLCHMSLSFLLERINNAQELLNGFFLSHQPSMAFSSPAIKEPEVVGIWHFQASGMSKMEYEVGSNKGIASGWATTTLYAVSPEVCISLVCGCCSYISASFQANRKESVYVQFSITSSAPQDRETRPPQGHFPAHPSA